MRNVIIDLVLMKQAQKDYYYRKARREGYRARSSYKLIQMNSKYQLIKRNDTVLDLGAAPGGWLQVAKDISCGVVLGVDRKEIEPIEGVKIIKGDIFSEFTLTKIRREITYVDVVICDASPNLSGNWSYDHARSIDLASTALGLCKEILKDDGNFAVKVFQGNLYNGFLKEMSKRFAFVKGYTPDASRKESAEIYVIGKRFIRCAQD
ncbi:MAG: RlmE family RNA methyltransferase [Halobacteriota archaeon]|nr:RlmE family RNA methyltransferase [Halobacteriota archaeon]